MRSTHPPACPPAQTGLDPANCVCIPFRAWNPGLVCTGFENVSPWAGAYQMAVKIKNLSGGPLNDVRHRFAVQLGPV